VQPIQVLNCLPTFPEVGSIDTQRLPLLPPERRALVEVATSVQRREYSAVSGIGPDDKKRYQSLDVPPFRHFYTSWRRCTTSGTVGTLSSTGPCKRFSICCARKILSGVALCATFLLASLNRAAAKLATVLNHPLLDTWPLLYISRFQNKFELNTRRGSILR
jgi:hypothetical protein